MELLNLYIVLTIWQSVIFISLILTLCSLIILARTHTQHSGAILLFWLILILFVPLVGALLFLFNRKRGSST
ncbi:MAG: PLDc N-terminal domain-containing protein [Thermonemataceae bacterium]